MYACTHDPTQIQKSHTPFLSPPMHISYAIYALRKIIPDLLRQQGVASASKFVRFCPIGHFWNLKSVRFCPIGQFWKNVNFPKLSWDENGHFLDYDKNGQNATKLLLLKSIEFPTISAL